jgi:hypothetical protein
LLAAVLIRFAPQWLTNTEGLNAVQRDEAHGRTRTAVFALLAGSIAVVGAIYTARTFALNRRGQITERFTRAIEQLGDDKIEIRLGGIYALERIAHESPEEHGPILEVLSAYVRENSPWPPREPRIPPARAPSLRVERRPRPYRRSRGTRRYRAGCGRRHEIHPHRALAARPQIRV